jgi:hypothetical protein
MPIMANTFAFSPERGFQLAGVLALVIQVASAAAAWLQPGRRPFRLAMRFKMP